jgi:hypothetical protein
MKKVPPYIITYIERAFPGEFNDVTQMTIAPTSGAQWAQWPFIVE